MVAKDPALEAVNAAPDESATLDLIAASNADSSCQARWMRSGRNAPREGAVGAPAFVRAQMIAPTTIAASMNRFVNEGIAADGIDVSEGVPLGTASGILVGGEDDGGLGTVPEDVGGR